MQVILLYGAVLQTEREDILLPERYDGDEQALINRIIEEP